MAWVIPSITTGNFFVSLHILILNQFVMEFREIVEKRSSVRSFRDESVPPDHLREMIRIAAMAPSVNNFQPWKFMVITSRDLLRKMANIVSDKIQSLPTNESLAAENIKSQVEFFATFFRDAPALIVLLMEEYETVLEKGVRMTHEEINRERNFPDLQSAGACIENLLLAAVDMGYGACWLSAPLMAANELAQLLEVEKPYRIIAFTAVGKPAHNPLPKSRKELDELIIWKE